MSDKLLESISSNLKRHIDEIAFERCEGCHFKWCSQKDHDCLMMNEEDKVLNFFDKAWLRLDKDQTLSVIKKSIWKKMTGESLDESH